MRVISNFVQPERMEQPSHPISLDRVFFTRSVVIAIPEHKAGEGIITMTPTNDLDISPLDEGGSGLYMATMRSVMNAENDPIAPYKIDMECVGIFTVDDTLNAEDALRGVTITAHSVLYGAIREAVSWITGRQPYGPLSLGLSVLRSAAPTE